MNSDVSNNFIKRVPTLTFDLSQHSCIPFNQLLHIMRKFYQITFTYHEKILSNQHCYFNLTLSKCQKKILLGVLTLTAFNGWPWTPINCYMYMYSIYNLRPPRLNNKHADWIAFGSTFEPLAICHHLIQETGNGICTCTRLRLPNIQGEGQEYDSCLELHSTHRNWCSSDYGDVMSKLSGFNKGTAELLFHTTH